MGNVREHGRSLEVPQVRTVANVGSSAGPRGRELVFGARQEFRLGQEVDRHADQDLGGGQRLVESRLERDASTAAWLCPGSLGHVASPKMIVGAT